MITAQTCKELRKDLNHALEEVLKKHGLEGKATKIGYTDTTVSVKLECNVEGVNPMIEQWNRYRVSYNFDDIEFGHELVHPTLGKVSVAGVKPRAPKYPILLKQESTGDVYKFNASDVQRWL